MTLLEQAQTLNSVVERSYLELACVLSQISELKLYEEAGHDSYAEYVEQELKRSKTFASNLLLVGNFLRANNYLPEQTQTSYARLAQSIRTFKDKEPEYILAAATTNTEHELILERSERENGPHAPEWVCKVCRTDQAHHA